MRVGKAILALVAALAVATPVAASEDVTLAKGQAKEVRLSAPAKTVSVVDGEVADVILRPETPKNGQIQALNYGRTEITFKNDEGEVLANYDVQVTADADSVNRALKGLMPEASVSAAANGGTVRLTGAVRDKGSAERAAEIASDALGGDVKVVNDVAVTGGHQVHLRVKVAEVERSVGKELGMDGSFSAADDDFIYGDGLNARKIPRPDVFDDRYTGESITGAVTSGLMGANSIGIATNVFGGSFKGILDALEEDGLVRTLAEPNLTAVSGKTAEMLAGGEIPIPVPQGDTVTIQYREFGVGLEFKPVVTGPGRIKLEVRTNVSTLDRSNGVRVAGVNVPGLNNRRASTTVEVPSGGSIVMAGLLQDNIQSQIDGVDWAKDLPVLGPLFSSSNFQANRTELVVSVSAYLVKPVDPEALSDPASHVAPPSDADLYIYRELTGQYGGSAGPAPKGAASYFGYALD